MALYVGLDVSLRMTSICVVEADGSSVWDGKAESEPVPLVKAFSPWRDKIALVGIEACPLSEWLYGALVESGPGSGGLRNDSRMMRQRSLPEWAETPARGGPGRGSVPETRA